MRRRLFAVAALSPIVLSATPATAAVARPPADAKPLSEIVKSLEDAGFAPIVEVEFRAGRWHVEAFKDGQKRDLRVHPVSGEITSNRRS
jgi:hypothetical protein